MSRRFLWIALAAVACGDSSSPVGIDSPVGGGSGSGSDPTTAVTIHVVGEPGLMQFRDGSGDWQPMLTPGSDGTAIIHVHDDYEVLVLCADDGSDFDAEMRAAVASDADQTVSCFTTDDEDAGSGSGSGSGSATTFAVTGTMAQAGTVRMGRGRGSGTTSPWTFDLNVVPGTYDLVAFDTAKAKMLLRRDVAVTTAPVAVTPALDLDTEGGALVTTALTITNAAANAKTTTRTSLTTDHANVNVFAGSDANARLVPPSLLTADDVQRLTVSLSTTRGQQGATTTGAGSAALPTSFALLPALTGVTFSHGTGTILGHWTSLPDVDADVEVIVQTETQQQTTSATHAWIAKTGATALGFDTAVPGYKAIWDVDVTAQFFAAVELAHADGATVYTSAITDLDGQQVRLRRRRR